MKKHPNLILGLLLLAFLAAGGLQGARIGRVRETGAFYTWVMAAGEQLRLEGYIGLPPEEIDAAKFMDRPLFDRIAEKAERALPDIPVTDEAKRADGTPYPKITRYMLVGSEAPEEASTPTKGFLGFVKQLLRNEQSEYVQARRQEQRQRDRLVWDLLRGPELAPERHDFAAYKRDEKLASIGTQFGLGAMYAVQDTSVSLGNLLFGFRKMAANLIWLQVDKFWHAGMLHRMVPLMNTTVALDPHFVDAFLIGAWHLAYNIPPRLDVEPEELKKLYPKYKARLDQRQLYQHYGIDFLKDGIRKNPREYKLYFDLGFAIYEEKLKDHVNAVKYLSEAVRHRHDQWVPRTLYRVMQNNGQYEEAIVGWKRYLKRYPDNRAAPRFIKIGEAQIKDREAARAHMRIQIAREAAEKEQARADQARKAAEQARQAGDAAKADMLHAQAAEAEGKVARYRQLGEAAREDCRKRRAEARQAWEHVNQDIAGEDPYATAKLCALEAADLVDKGQYEEAVALLDFARFGSNRFWDEGSDLIIAIKEKGGIPLALTEKLYLERKEKAKELDALLPKTINGRIYELRGDVWYQEEYRPREGEQIKVVKAGSDELFDLVWEYPEVQKVLALGDKVVFLLNNTWYRYEAKSASPSAMEPPSA